MLLTISRQLTQQGTTILTTRLSQAVKFNSKTYFQNTVSYFWAVSSAFDFRVFKTCYYDQNKFLLHKCNIGIIKKRRILSWFYSEKFQKTMRKKLSAKKWQKIKFLITACKSFRPLTSFGLFSLPFFNGFQLNIKFCSSRYPYRIFSKNILLLIQCISTFLLTLKPNVDEKAEKNENVSKSPILHPFPVWEALRFVKKFKMVVPCYAATPPCAVHNTSGLYNTYVTCVCPVKGHNRSKSCFYTQ